MSSSHVSPLQAILLRRESVTPFVHCLVGACAAVLGSAHLVAIVARAAGPGLSVAGPGLLGNLLIGFSVALPGVWMVRSLRAADSFTGRSMSGPLVSTLLLAGATLAQSLLYWKTFPLALLVASSLDLVLLAAPATLQDGRRSVRWLRLLGGVLGAGVLGAAVGTALRAVSVEVGVPLVQT